MPRRKCAARRICPGEVQDVKNSLADDCILKTLQA